MHAHSPFGVYTLRNLAAIKKFIEEQDGKVTDVSARYNFQNSKASPVIWEIDENEKTAFRKAKRAVCCTRKAFRCD